MKAEQFDALLTNNAPVVVESQSHGTILALPLGRDGQQARVLTTGMTRSASGKLMKINEVYHQRPDVLAFGFLPPGVVMTKKLYDLQMPGNVTDWGRNPLGVLKEVRSQFLGVAGYRFKAVCGVYAEAAKVIQDKIGLRKPSTVPAWMPRTTEHYELEGHLWMKRHAAPVPKGWRLVEMSVAAFTGLLRRETYLAELKAAFTGETYGR